MKKDALQDDYVYTETTYLHQNHLKYCGFRKLRLICLWSYSMRFIKREKKTTEVIEVARDSLVIRENE